MIKKLLLISLLTTGCAMPLPVKKHKKIHKSTLKKALSKYRRVLNEHDWEVTNSDADGGILKAIKGQVIFGTVAGIYRANLNCYEKDKNDVSCQMKIQSCQNTVPLSGCSSLSEYWAEKDLKDFLNDIGGIK